MLRVFSVVAVLVGAYAKVRYDGHKLISIYAKNQQDVDFLNSLEDQHGFRGLDFWSHPSIERSTDIRLSPSDFDKLRELLNEVGMEFKVVKDNIQIDIDIEEESMRRSKARNTGLCDITNEYCTFEQIEKLLNDWSSNNQGKMEFRIIGRSYYDYPIYMVSIFEQYSLYKPAIIVEAGTHAREWITVSSALVLIKELLSGSAKSQTLLSKYDWYIVPVHNPEGYDHSVNFERLWRKNLAPCGGTGSNVGIDLNRNWNVSHGDMTVTLIGQHYYPLNLRLYPGVKDYL